MSKLQIRKQALERAVNVVTKAPEKGQHVYKNVAKISSGTLCHIRENDDELTTDVPPSIGGEGRSPSPGVLMRSALTGCVAIGIKLWAAREDIHVESVEVTLEADSDTRGQLGVDDAISPGIEALRMEIVVIADADPSMMEEIINTSLKYSPILDVFSNPRSIKVNLDVHNSTATRH